MDILALGIKIERDESGATRAVVGDLEAIEKASQSTRDALKAQSDTLKQAKAAFAAMSPEIRAMAQASSTAARDSEVYTRSLGKFADVIGGRGLKQEVGALAVALKNAGGAGQLAGPAFDFVAKKAKELQAAGATLPPTLQAIVHAQDQAAASAQKLGGVMGFMQGIVQGMGQALGQAALSAIKDIATLPLDAAQALMGAAQHAVEFGGSLTDLAAKAGISTTALQELSAAGLLVGVGQEKIATSVQDASRIIAEGGKQASQAVHDLGLNLANLQQLSPDQLFRTLVQALHDVKDPGVQAALAVDVLGKSAKEVMKLIRSDFEAATRSARDFGLVVSADTVAALDKTGDAVDVLSKAWEVFQVNLGAILATTPGVVEAIMGMVEELSQWSAVLEENKVGIQGFLEGGLTALVDTFRGARVEFGETTAVLRDVAASLNQLGFSNVQIAEAAMAVTKLFAEIGGPAGQAALLIFERLNALREKGAAVRPGPKEKQDFGFINDAVKGFQEWATAAEKARVAAIPVETTIVSIGKSQKQLAKEARAAAKEVRDESKAFDELQKVLRSVEKQQHVDATLFQAEAVAMLTAQLQKQLEVQFQINELGQSTAPIVNVSDADMAKAVATAAILAELVERKKELAGEKLQGSIIDDLIGKSTDAGTIAILKKMKEETKGVTKETVDWSSAIQGVVALMSALGISSDSVFGKMLGSIGAAASAFQNMQERMKTGGGGLGGMFKEKGGGLSVGSLLGGITAALGAAAAAVQIGKAIFGLFHKSPAEKAAEQAGKDLGFKVSKALGEALAKTMKDLKVDLKSAEALNLDKIFAESGKSITAFQGQVKDLFAMLAQGGKVAAEAVKQIGFAFTEAKKAAEAGDKAARKMMVSMIQQARAAGAAVPEIAAAVKENLDKAFTGLTALLKGIPLTDQQDVEDQAVLMASVFWAKVREDGIVSAALAFGEVLADWEKKLEESGLELTDATAAMIAPIAELGRLAADETTRPLLEGIQGARDMLNGLTDSGYMTVGAFSALGGQAQTAFDALIANGVSEQMALMAIAPLLGDLKAASELYGVELDANTQKLIEQAEAAGVAFPTDPLLQVVDLLSEMVRLLGGELPDSVRASARAFDSLGNHATSAAHQAGNAWQNVHLPDAGSASTAGPSGPPGGYGAYQGNATGGIIMPRPGGVPRRIAEGNQAELVAPVRAFADQLVNRMVAATRGTVGGAGAQGGPSTVVVQVKVGERELGLAIADLKRRGHTR